MILPGDDPPRDHPPGPSGQGRGSCILAVGGSIPRPCGREITTFDENFKSRGSICDHFPPIGLARGAMRNSFFRKEFRTCQSRFLENDRKISEMASKRRSRGPDTGNLHEMSIRIQWRWSWTPKSGFGGRKYIQAPGRPPLAEIMLVT